MASYPGPSFSSPDGHRNIKIYFNDAGGMHSGNHWTWVVENHWVTGPRVVSEGYLGGEHAQGKEAVPITWSNNHDFKIDYLPTR